MSVTHTVLFWISKSFTQVLEDNQEGPELLIFMIIRLAKDTHGRDPFLRYDELFKISLGGELFGDAYWL